MSIHGTIDEIALSLGAKFMPKYFRDGFNSPPVAEHLQAVSLEIPELNGEGDYEITASSLVGQLNAAFRLAHWEGDDVPTLIYHHGASEIPFDYGFKRIFPLKKIPARANLFLVRAPFHRSMKDFQHGIRTLANVVAMLAVSVKVIEGIVETNREKKVPRILVAGTSLGGFITNLHHIHCGSADAYTPLLAGLAMNDAYLRSAYSRAVDLKAKENPADIDTVLNFRGEFSEKDSGNVFPLLARHDRIVRYPVQKDSYGNRPVVTLEKGHATGALAYGALRSHVFDVLQR